MDRRHFIRSLLAATSATGFLGTSFAGSHSSKSDKLGKLLPIRPLGKTGDSITIMGLGGYHMAIGSEKESQTIIEAALEEGIRFFDQAVKYHRGRAEDIYGKFLIPKYREHIYLMSKCDTRDPQIPAAQQLEDSLRRMKTDYLDMWLVHTIIDKADAEYRVKEMLEVAEKAKQDGKIRHFGFSGHKATEAHLAALEMTKKEPVDTVLMPISPSDFVSRDSFIVNVLPKLVEQQIGPLAMKTMNSGRFAQEFEGKRITPERLSIEEHQWFSLSLPVTSWVSGMTNVDEVRQNADIARRYTKLSEEDRLAIADKISDMADIAQLQPYRQWNT